MPGMDQGAGEEELVSRPVQSTWGLGTAVLVYGASVGGIFALVYAFASGRFTGVSPRGLAALLGACGVHNDRNRTRAEISSQSSGGRQPGHDWPPHRSLPGDDRDLDRRDGLGNPHRPQSLSEARPLARDFGRRVALYRHRDGRELLLPDVQEVPEGFPAVVLWRFRVANLGIQAVLWSTMGLLFGYLPERNLQVRRAVLRPAH